MPWGAAFASSLTTLLAAKLVGLAITEIGNMKDVGKNLSLLSDRVWIIQTTLDRLGDKELSKRLRRECVDDLIELFYKVDDIIDGIDIDIMMKNHEPSHHVEGTTSTTSILAAVFTMFRNGNTSSQPTPPSSTQVKKNILYSLKKCGLPRKIKSLLKNLDRIEKKIEPLTRSSPSHPAIVREPNDIFSHTAPVNLVSTRKRAMETIINHLIGGRDVSIVGMPGLGKTTLARCIRRHHRIRKHFNIIWAKVPGGVLTNGSNLDFEKQSNIESVDNGRKILLVLDHLYEVHYRDWENFRSNFEASHGKATLLITTLNLKVAADTDTTPYHLELLSDQDCDELIKETLPEDVRNQFGHRIARIAKTCAGLPLAADVLGMAMRAGFRERPVDIEGVISRFERRDLWTSDVFQKQILPYLRFGETPELNRLLAYLSLFPARHPLQKHELSQLWMADGFVHPEKWDSNGLQKAIQCFDNLMQRSLLHLPNNNSQEGTNAIETPYQVHEFTHRVALSLAHNMYCQIKEGDKADGFPPSHTRHLSIHRQTVEPRYLENITSTRLRTFLLLHEKGTNICKLPKSLFHSLSLLRVLKLGKSGITELPRSIGNLKHLRYLDASNTSITNLPDSICKLLGLRVIKLKKTPLRLLPKDIANLVNLIQLDVDMKKLDEPPQNIGMLTQLKSLETFIVADKEGRRISELSKLNDLEGSMRILGLEKVTSLDQARDALLEEKPHLKKLELHWKMSEIRTMVEQSSVRNIAEQLLPNTDLSELRLMSYGGDMFPTWLSSPSCHLSTIHLFNCSFSSIQNAEFWKLQFLKELLIDEVHEWTEVGRRFFGGSNDSERFKVLEKLEIRNMENLRTWEGIEPGNVLPRLRHLKLENCPILSGLPGLNQSPTTANINIEIERCPKITVAQV